MINDEVRFSFSLKVAGGRGGFGLPYLGGIMRKGKMMRALGIQ